LVGLAGGWIAAKKATLPWMVFWGAVGLAVWYALMALPGYCRFDGVYGCIFSLGVGLITYLLSYGLSRLVLSKRAKK